MRARVNPNQLGSLAMAYVLQSLYLVMGRYAIDNVVIAGYEFIYHPSLQIRRVVLFRHPFIIAILTGLFLGFLPFQALASMFTPRSRPNERWSQFWQSTKPWIAAPFLIGFLLAVRSYVVSAPGDALSAWRGFFAAPCDFDTSHLLVYRSGCANQLLYTAPLACALIYSLTALLDRRRHSAGREDLSVTTGTTSEIV